MFKRALFTSFVTLCIALLLTSSISAQENQTEEHTGFMGDTVPDDYYPVSLEAGQTITVTAEATSGNLDTYIGLESPDEVFLIENDDRNAFTLDSYFTYTVDVSGLYHVVVSNIQGTNGEYLLTIETSSTAGQQPEIPQTSGELWEQVYTGFMSDDRPDDRYPIQLEAGEAIIITAEATSGDLDTYIVLLDPDGVRVAENDDRDASTLDSEIIFIAPTSGEYTVVVSNYPDSAGDYRLTITSVDRDEAEINLRVRLSGPVLFYDTEHFRIHYTLEGKDATTLEYVQAVGEAMEEVRTIQIDQLGWAAPPDDGILGGDSRYDVYLVDLLDDDEGGELGSATPELPAGDNPNTTIIEDYATASYIILDNDYNEEDYLDGGSPISLMRATAAHEFHHAIQFGYDFGERHRWYYEATAAWMETITFPEEQAATGYVETVFTYPEVCLGVEGDADPTEGSLQYGQWLFIQSLVDAHGERAPHRLWENIALYEGWEVLEETLAFYGESIPEAVTRYHLQNLVRDYAFTPDFEDNKVWLESVIETTGNWTFTGRGIQELAANYFELALPPGVYNLSLRDETTDLELWVLGIKGAEGAAIPLGVGGNVDLSSYSDTYLMVFNPAYIDELAECAYQSYTIDVLPGDGTPARPAFALNASQFTPLN